MEPTPAQYAEALYETVKASQKKELAAIMRRLMLLLRRRRHWRMLPAIERAFHEVVYAREGLVPVRVVSAHPLPIRDELRWIRHAVKSVASHASHIRADVERRVDSSLIGGVVISVRGYKFDVSLRNYIEKLKQALQQNGS